MSLTIKIRTRLVIHWATIAIEQERLAREGRDRLLANFKPAEGSDLTIEHYPAMISVAACSHSLEALYSELAELVTPETLAKWEKRRRGGRWAQIAAMLELSIDVDVARWRSSLRTLFEERRNPVVHPKSRLQDPAPHPALPINVAPEYRIYSIETATESVDLLLDILSAFVESPKPAVEQWAKDQRAWVERLRGLRH
jgi:hypothetical protein